MRNILKTMPLCAALLCTTAMAQDAVPAVEPTESQPVAELATVEVSNTKDPELKPYRTMWKSFAAFGTHHRLAPHADLRFILISQTDTAIKGLEMRLAGEETSTPIAVADDGTFTLPHSQIAFDDNAELLLNRKRTPCAGAPTFAAHACPLAFNAWATYDWNVKFGGQ